VIQSAASLPADFALWRVGTGLQRVLIVAQWSIFDIHLNGHGFAEEEEGQNDANSKPWFKGAFYGVRILVGRDHNTIYTCRLRR
jgi:hypothetical protein